MHVLQLEAIRYAYDRRREVLCDVSLSVGPGEVVGLLGVNGSGKTTLLRIAMGMLRPREGTVRLFGLDPRVSPVEVKRRVGYVAEGQLLPAHLRVGQVLDLHRALFPTWDHGLEGELKVRLRIDGRARVGRLSKGEARRVALLCAVAHRPELLILDEPAGGLDPAARREFLETTIALLNAGGTSIVFSSHHMSDVERIAGRAALLHEGALLLDEPLDELREAFCLVVTQGIPLPHLMGMEGCVRARAKDGVSRALFLGSPEEVAARFDGRAARCTRISLEEFFIEMVEGRS